MPTNPDLAALSEAATQGEWEVDSEYDNDAMYSGGGGCGSGFKNYFIGTDIDGKWKTLLDTVNSDYKLVDEDYDEDGKQAWDTIGHANAAFITALVNEYRAGRLVHIDEGMRERVAKAMCRADPEVRMGDASGVVEQRVQHEWKHYLDAADAAIAAMMGGAK